MTLTVKTTGLEDYLSGGAGKIKLLLGGAPGAGKTRFSSFAPKPIYADCEDGLMSVADRRVPYASIRSAADMTAFLDLLDAEGRKPAAEQRFQTVVIDTLDAYQRLVTTEYLRKHKKEAMSGWEDWGYLDAKMTGLLARLFLLPMNVIALMHVKDTKINEVDATIPKLKGDMRDQIAADFDFVGLLGTEFGPVPSAKGGNERGVIRSIKWESTPMAPWLKCRGGALTETPVAFTDADWSVIQERIAAQLQGLQKAETIQQIDTPSPEPVKVAPGGPVESVPNSGTAPTKPSTPKPPVVGPPPAKARPVVPAVDVANPPTEEQAVATLEKTLGAERIEEPEGQPQDLGTAEAVAELTPAPGPEEPSATPVAEPEVAPIDFPGLSEVEEALRDPAQIPADGTVTVICGTARSAGAIPRHPDSGCGQPLTVLLEGGRVAGAEDGQKADLIEIAALRERTFLHNACYGAVRNAK